MYMYVFLCVYLCVCLCLCDRHKDSFISEIHLTSSQTELEILRYIEYLGT